MRAAPLLLLAAAAVLSGCGRHSDHRPPPAPAQPQAAAPTAEPAAGAAAQGYFDPKSDPDVVVGAPLDPHQLTPTQLQYGIAPRRDPHVTYAPDVILMEEGDKAIRMCASDGMTWVFDAAAPHVSEFQEGKIVFATGRAVGRIGQLQRSGDTVIVRLAPVQITEVVQEGHFMVSGPFHPQDLIVYTAPDFPSTVDLAAPAARSAMAWGAGSGVPRLLRTAFVPVAAPGAGPPVPAPAAAIGKAPTLNLSDGDLKIYPLVGSDTSIGVEYDFDKSGTHLKSSGRLRLGGASVKFELNIVHGHIRKFGMDLTGMAALEFEFESYSDKEAFINAYRVADPAVDMTIPMPAGGLPLALTVHTKFVFKTGFSAKTSTLTAHARYSLTGDLFIGKEDGSPPVKATITPKADVDLGNTLDGVSVGINSMNITFMVQPMVGIGAFGFSTGVYVALTFGGDVVKQSSIALPCKEGFMRVSMDSGVGYQLAGPFVAFVNTILSSFTKYRLEKNGTLIPGPHADLMNENTQAPPGCATPKQGAPQ